SVLGSIDSDPDLVAAVKAALRECTNTLQISVVVREMDEEAAAGHEFDPPGVGYLLGGARHCIRIFGDLTECLDALDNTVAEPEVVLADERTQTGRILWDIVGDPKPTESIEPPSRAGAYEGNVSLVVRKVDLEDAT